MPQATQEDGALFLEVTPEHGECLPCQDMSQYALKGHGGGHNLLQLLQELLWLW